MLRAMSVRSLAVLLACLVPLGCDDTAEKAKDAVEKTEKAVEKTQEVIEKTEKTIEKGKETAQDLKDKAAIAKKILEDVPKSGELTDSAKNWLKEHSGEMETVVVTGVQIAPVAWEIAKVLNEAVDSETVVEPVFQDVDDVKKIDEAIDGMPRVEVIDGLNVGFKQLDSTDAKQNVKERAYLVTWRHESHLVGFVYRSQRTVDIETLVKEAPRLISLTKTALDKIDKNN